MGRERAGNGWMFQTAMVQAEELDVGLTGSICCWNLDWILNND